jgi:hypothetical protein
MKSDRRQFEVEKGKVRKEKGKRKMDIGNWQLESSSGNRTLDSGALKA